MYGDVVLKLKPENKNDPDPFEELIDHKKTSRGVSQDVDLNVDDLKGLPCRPCCQGCGGLLPHRFTIAGPVSGA